MPAAKRAATSPAPSRRTPRKSAGTSPARLGLNDSWGPGASSKWVSVDNDTKEKLETEKVAKREKAVAKQNNEDSKKRQTFTIDDTGLKSKKFPRLAASLQGAFLAGLGEVIASMIKDTPQDAERVATFVIWGFLLAQLLVPYLAFANKTKLVKKNKVLDSAGKAVCEQLCLVPLVLTLHLVYFKFAQEGTGVTNLVGHVQDNFVVRYQAAAAFSACMAFANFFLVPASTQLLMLNLTSLAWTVVTAYIN